MRERRTDQYRQQMREARRQRMLHRGAPQPSRGATGLVPLLIALVLILGCGALATTRFLGATRELTGGAPPTGDAGTSSTRAPATADGSATPVSTQVTVKPGETLSDVSNELQEKGIIRNATLFRLDVRVRGIDPSIQPGTYALNSGMTTEEIVETMRRAPEKPQATVLFKEGWRLEEDGTALEAANVVKRDDFVKAASDASTFKAQYSFLGDAPKGASLNGFLFPDTYKFEVPATSSEIIDRQLSRFGQQVTPEMIEQAKKNGHTLWEVMVIASIVEREAQAAAERPTIAGVYWNRLKSGEGLFADPTVQYALGWDAANKTWWRVLTTDELKVDSPYNTYKVHGLPPNPICNPGLASIQAALSPQGDFQYMVAKGDGTGTHAFAKTLDEHNANRQKYQK